MVVPHGVLFGDDAVCVRIKEELLREFNLHTIVRLPKGVFSPYADIPSNLLFFDRSGPTKEVWFYELPLPEGRRAYTKNSPLRFEEFAECLSWWKHRSENSRAWKVPVDQIIAAGFNLDRHHPNVSLAHNHVPPKELMKTMLEKHSRLGELLTEISKSVDGIV
jgi:type I restriction enzyme M protein